ncbi:Trifunctional NAD biosynthesis/regulator protein NadR [Paraconexibacter sp. AEG42_29]|uniref:Trifunctional NAD biosynthesis/regulator protein NadR n=1 Tax=Paraconexibacter sp. AEG42_29 TaxID=2997339 RepID=A0AAU7AU24_9ACTN
MSVHGVVLGKFYPPHAGHHHLIDTAVAQCDTVTVILAGATCESIPLELRAAWLRERHPDVRVVAGVDDHPVDYTDPHAWDVHMEVFLRLCPEPVDLVFSSEAYGEELARRFGGARHVLVDLPRRAVPVSGTAVRADPPGQWALIGPAVRAYLTRRIALVGAESTGTTTLARALAAHYATEWVPEYGRRYTEELVDSGVAMDAIVWDDAAFELIARRQCQEEDDAARRASPVLICDTPALATAVWQERYLGHTSAAVEAIGASREYALHILTGPEIPFEQDGYRDGEHVRAWMTGRLRERLTAVRAPVIEVTGTLEERMAASVAAIDAALVWTFAEPLG